MVCLTVVNFSVSFLIGVEPFNKNDKCLENTIVSYNRAVCWRKHRWNKSAENEVQGKYNTIIQSINSRAKLFFSQHIDLLGHSYFFWDVHFTANTIDTAILHMKFYELTRVQKKTVQSINNYKVISIHHAKKLIAWVLFQRMELWLIVSCVEISFGPIYFRLNLKWLRSFFLMMFRLSALLKNDSKSAISLGCINIFYVNMHEY